MIKLVRRQGSPFVFINGNVPKDVFTALDDVTSYFTDDYERTDAFQSGKWDGKTRLLYTAKNGAYYFPFGLIDRVCSILRAFGIQYVINDETTGIGARIPYPFPEKTGKISLRQYQVTALNNLITTCHNKSGVIALPTGAGKTVLALAWMQHTGKNTIIVVHRKELFQQWEQEILKLTDIEKDRIGYVNDTRNDAGKDKDVLICMVQSLDARIQKGLIKDLRCDLLIIDECHTCPAKTVYRALTRINATYRLGLSATPTRTDGAELKIFAACGCIADVISVSDLVDLHYLTIPKFNMIQSHADGIKSSETWSNVYKQGIVMNIDRNQKIVDIAMKHEAEGRQIYIHVNQVQHGKNIIKTLSQSGIDATWVCGSTSKKERDRIIQAYRDGQIRILVSTLLKEGVSIDGISCLIYAAGMKSEVSVIQTIGRALRIDPKFNDAMIYDFVDSGHWWFLEEHSKQRIFTYREIYGKYFEV